MATPFNQLLSHPVDPLGNPAKIVNLFYVKVYVPFQIHEFTRTEIIFSINNVQKQSQLMSSAEL